MKQATLSSLNNFQTTFIGARDWHLNVRPTDPKRVTRKVISTGNYMICERTMESTKTKTLKKKKAGSLTDKIPH